MNPNKNNRPLVIALVIFIIILLIAIIFLLMRKPVSAPTYGNNNDVPVVINQQNNNPVVATLPVTGPKYEDSPESKVVKEESPAYITAFEKRTDGYWYASVDYLQIVQGQGLKNESAQIRTFRVSSNVKIYQFDKMLNESGTYFTFDQYKNFLTKENGHYINRVMTSGGPGTPNGYYDIFIENGQIVTMDEFYDHEVNG